MSGSERVVGRRRRPLDLQVKLPPLLPAEADSAAWRCLGAGTRCESHWVTVARRLRRSAWRCLAAGSSTCVWRERFLRRDGFRADTTGEDADRCLGSKCSSSPELGCVIVSVGCFAAELLPHRTEPASPRVVAFQHRCHRQGVALAWPLVAEWKRREERPCALGCLELPRSESCI